MNKLSIIALLTIFSMSCLNSSAQFDSKVWEKQIKLTETRNRRRPKGVSRGFKKLYKKEYGLSKVQLPFNSFTSIYPEFYENYSQSEMPQYVVANVMDYFSLQNQNQLVKVNADGTFCGTEVVYRPLPRSTDIARSQIAM